LRVVNHPTTNQLTEVNYLLVVVRAALVEMVVRAALVEMAV
jgi:hypothetical protein